MSAHLSARAGRILLKGTAQPEGPLQWKESLGESPRAPKQRVLSLVGKTLSAPLFGEGREAVCRRNSYVASGGGGPPGPPPCQLNGAYSRADAAFLAPLALPPSCREDLKVQVAALLERAEPVGGPRIGGQVRIPTLPNPPSLPLPTQLPPLVTPEEERMSG